jgi:hypothetical protein
MRLVRAPTDLQATAVKWQWRGGDGRGRRPGFSSPAVRLPDDETQQRFVGMTVANGEREREGERKLAGTLNMGDFQICP